jgi:hypothetical protein|tara:strand:- start:185 stop:1012 length:828 start_codon:yes stop_codon:yes gene_type:complete
MINLDYKMESHGFVHIKNVFPRKSIEIVSNYLQQIDFNEKSIEYNNISYDDKNGIIKDLKCETIGMKDYLVGYNFNVNSDQRTVIQMYYTGLDGDAGDVPNPYLGKLCSNDTMRNVKQFSRRNKQMIENILSQTNELYPYLSKYPKHDYTKLFINEPGCKDQELHCDDPEDIEREKMYIIIPLNDCDTDMGTTIFYDANHVGKYLTNDESWYNKGPLENLNGKIKEDFQLAEYNVPFQIGDAVLFFGDSVHRGTCNRSDKNRLFLHLAFRDHSRP